MHNPSTVILQYGILGVFTAVIMFFIRQLILREQNRAAQLEQALNDKTRAYDAITRTLEQAGMLKGGDPDLADYVLDTDGNTRVIRELARWWEAEQEGKRNKKVTHDRA